MTRNFNIFIFLLDCRTKCSIRPIIVSFSVWYTNDDVSHPDVWKEEDTTKSLKLPIVDTKMPPTHPDTGVGKKKICISLTSFCFRYHKFSPACKRKCFEMFLSPVKFLRRRFNSNHNLILCGSPLLVVVIISIFVFIRTLTSPLRLYDNTCSFELGFGADPHNG